MVKFARLLLCMIPLAVSGAASRTLGATVAPMQGQTMQPRFQISSHEPWVREQVLVTLAVQTPEEFASLKVATPVMEGFEVIPLPTTRQPVKTKDGKQYQLRVGWALFPLRDGKQALQLPPVQYRLEGGTRQRFMPPPIQLQVKPLPSYVPPTMPVGRLQLQARLRTLPLIRSGQLDWWQVDIAASGLPTQWLPRPDNLLQGGSGVGLLPPETTDQSHPDADGVNSRLAYRIPFIPKAGGLLDLPTLELQYFDPASGKLQRLRERPWRPLVLPAPLWWLAILLVLAVMVLGLRWSGIRTMMIWQGMRQRRAALKSLLRASDHGDIRAALRCFALAEGWPANLSLGAWKGRWQQRYVMPATLSQNLALLDRCSYSQKTATDCRGLKSGLHDCLRQRKRRRHPFAVWMDNRLTTTRV